MKQKTNFIMLPTVDFCFKELMQNPKVRRGFIAALLKIDHHTFHFRDDKTGKLFSDKMELQILELPKLPKEMQIEEDIKVWMKFFSGKSKEEFERMAKTNEYLDAAYQELLEISADEKKRLQYEAREKALKDYNTQISSAEARGEARGEERGEAKQLISQVCKKLKRGMDIAAIADALETDSGVVDYIYNIARQFQPEYDSEKVYRIWVENPMGAR